MNIFIPHKWLLEHLDTKADPQTIAKTLSLSGPSVERVSTVSGDQVYDIEVTTNRVDSMSVRGIAREAAAVLPEFDIPAKLKPLKLEQIQEKVNQKSLPDLDFDIQNDPDLCHRILAIKLTNIKIGPSPKLIQDRLIQVDQRPLDNIIDLTNYIMWDMGHPIHAFDYDRLTQKKIIVRTAKKGEQFITLDQKNFTCVGGEVVFDDGTGTIVDLPGIMGTLNTTVTQDTTNVLLWIESIDAVKIRHASMTHSIRSQAAILNEKHVDPYLGKNTILKAIQMYQQNTQAELGSKLLDIFPNPKKPKPINLKTPDLQRYLGLDIDQKRVTRILNHLEFKAKYDQSTDTYLVTPPTFRQRDIQIYQDVIEEIARINGYHNLESLIMDTRIPKHQSHDNFTIADDIKDWLVGWGAQEIYTYSMISKELASSSGTKIEDHLTIKNPLIDDWTYLRTTLIASLTQVLDTNTSQKHTLFELQNIYPKAKNSDQLPNEQLQLAIVTNQSYSHLKGILDALFQKFYISDYQIKPETYSLQSFDPEYSASIYSGSTHLGYIGKLTNRKYSGLVINFSNFLGVASTHPTHISLNQYPPIIEDLTFTLPPKTNIGPIIDEIKSVSDLITSVVFKTQYQQNFTFTLQYRHPNHPLNDAQVAPIRKQVVTTLEKKNHAKLVGQLS